MTELQRPDLEQPVQRPRDVLLHPLYGHHRRDEHQPRTDTNGLAGLRLNGVLALAEVVARLVAKLVPEAHDGKVMR